MIITRDNFIRQIAEKEEVDTAAVRRIFQSAEDILSGCLTSASPAEPVVIRLFNGISIERKYIAKKTYSKGMFQDMVCPEHVNIKANISRYYNGQVNRLLFYRQPDSKTAEP